MSVAKFPVREQQTNACRTAVLEQLFIVFPYKASSPTTTTKPATNG